LSSTIRDGARDRRQHGDDHNSTVFVIDSDLEHRVRLEPGRGLHPFAIAEYASVSAFIADYDGARPACILLHLRVRGPNGIEALRRLDQQRIPLPVLILMDNADVATAVQMMKRGAADFLEAPIDVDELHNRIDDLLTADTERARADAAIHDASRRFTNLSQREHQILEMLLHGQGSKEIARHLGISSKTVDVHRTNLMRKVGVTSVAQLVNLALSIRHSRS
jgi:FixJ family two-component response regulator